MATNNKHKKTFGSLVSAILVVAYLAGWLAMLIWTKLQEAMPDIIFYIMAGVYIVSIIGIIVALLQRLKEINGGEEDEASKY